MVRKLLIGALVVLVLVAVGLFFWARSVLGRDAVRTALAAQIARAIGQPVAIGTVDASIYPRVTVNLGDVRIGEPARIHARTLHVGADFRALLSRRIEHAKLRLDGARIELPLPAFTLEPAAPEDGRGGSPAVEIVSIDEIVLADLQIVSSGRTLGGDIEVVPEGAGVSIRRMTLRADDTSVDVTGRITDLAAPAGELALTAGRLDVDRLLAFFQEFAAGAGLGDVPAAPPPSSPAGAARSPAMNMTVALEARQASMGALLLDGLTARLRVTGEQMALEPLAFGLFAGRYDGTLHLSPAGPAPSFRWNAVLSGIDVGAVTRFAGHPDVITGRLGGRIDLIGEAADTAAALRTARGTARVEIANGIVRNLGLVRNIVTATSMRGDAPAARGGSRDEPFRRLSATLAIAGTAARTSDLLFESENLRLTGAGVIRLDGSAVDVKGRVQLSEALTREAGRDLVRYTQEEGRVTLPVAISGPADRLSVRVEVADVMKRAIRNKATEEVDKAIKKGLGDLLRRR